MIGADAISPPNKTTKTQRLKDAKTQRLTRLKTQYDGP